MHMSSDPASTCVSNGDGLQPVILVHLHLAVQDDELTLRDANGGCLGTSVANLIQQQTMVGSQGEKKAHNIFHHKHVVPHAHSLIWGSQHKKSM